MSIRTRWMESDTLFNQTGTNLTREITGQLLMQLNDKFSM